MSPLYKHGANANGAALRSWLIYVITAFAVGLSLSYCTIQALVTAAKVVG